VVTWPVCRSIVGPMEPRHKSGRGIKKGEFTAFSRLLSEEGPKMKWNFMGNSRNNEHYAQTCTTASFYTLAPTCFGSSLPSSGSFWIRLSYMKTQIDLVICHIKWLSGHVTIHYMTYHLFDLYFM
jgi:hypothetical protein